VHTDPLHYLPHPPICLLDPWDAPGMAFIAGTFDAVCMNGILAVLLAGLPGWRWRRRDPRAWPGV
jgi:hypothetical protein